MIKEIEFKHSMNIVDNKGNFVGYDTLQDCCEECDHEYIYADGTSIQVQYLPDDAIIKSVTPVPKDKVPKVCLLGDKLHHGNEEFFSIVDGSDNLIAYLHIWNIHEGWYAHSWESGVIEVKSKGYI